MSNVAVFVPHIGCPARCSFCNQHIISGQQERVGAADVRRILEKALENERHGAHQIAFFGGSFTAMEREYIKELLDAAAPYRAQFAGLRISTRPDAIDEEILAFLKPYGVTAIELGAQSMDDEVLRLNRRGHTAADVERASRLIRENGFELGLQMMTGLYGDTPEKSLETARRFVALDAQTVRIYPTVVLEGTELDRLYKAGKYVPQSVEQAVEVCVRLIPIFEQAGIRIIRLGLHASEEVNGKQTAGAYHPAFKELCLAKIYYENALAVLRGRPKGAYTLAVGTRHVSQMTGQNKENIQKLAAAGYDIRVKADSTLPAYRVKLLNERTGKQTQCI